MLLFDNIDYDELYNSFTALAYMTTFLPSNIKKKKKNDLCAVLRQQNAL